MGSLVSCAQGDPQHCWVLCQNQLEPASRFGLTPSFLSLTIQGLTRLKAVGEQMSLVQALNAREERAGMAIFLGMGLTRGRTSVEYRSLNSNEMESFLIPWLWH